MYQGWQRKSAKGSWRLKKQPAEGKSENDFRKQFYTTGRSLKLLVITALMATSILIPPTFLHWVPHPPRPLTSNLLCSSTFQCLPRHRPAGRQPGFLHQEAKALNQAFHTFPPPTFQGAPTSLLFQWINHLCCQHKLKSNHVTSLLRTLLDPLSSHRAEAKAATKADEVLPALSPAASPSAPPVHSTLLLQSWKRPFVPPSCCCPGRGRASCCSLWGLCMCSPLCWHGIPPKRPEGSGPCWLQVCSNIFPGRPLLIIP